MRIINETTELVPVTQLRPHPKNARAGDVDEIHSSIRDNGFYGSLVVQRSTGYILAGNHRFQGALRAGARTLPVTWVDVDDTTALRILLVDNRTNDLAGYDDVALTNLLEEILEESGTLDGTGYDRDALDELLAHVAEEEARDEGDTLIVLPEAPKSQRGEVYELGPHRLMCGDSTDLRDVQRLMGGDRAHLVNTDPPYGVSYQGTGFDVIQNDNLRGDDLLSILMPALQLAAEFAVENAAFYIWHASSTRKDFEWAMDAAGLEEKQYILWAKDSFVLGHADYHWQHEPCFYARKVGCTPPFYADRTQSTVWRFAARRASGERSVALANGIRISNGAGAEVYVQPQAPKTRRTRLVRLHAGESVLLVPGPGGVTDLWDVKLDTDAYQHPTQKPVALAVNAIQNSSRPGDIVLDLFGGGGFTLLGAEATKRVARVMELDPRYCDVIRRRYAEFAGRPELAP